MARYHDVWLLTRGLHRECIADELRHDPVPGLRFVYVELPKWLLLFFKRSDHSHSFYYMWQLAAYFRARRVCRDVGIDLIHHISWSKFWAPAFISLLPVPFVWGPVGGGESMPRDFVWRCGFYGRMYETLRDLGRWVGEHDPFVRMTARYSAVALATTDASAERMRRIGAHGTVVYPAIGLMQEDLDAFDACSSPHDDSVRFLSIGRLLHWKGFDLGLLAFAKSGLRDAEYWVVGDGPERRRLGDIAAQLGIEGRVRFLGSKTRAETLKIIGQANLLVHPSLHESGGLVCLEALAARRPVICLDWGGPAIQVADGTGIRIPVCGVGQVISDLSDAMQRLGRDASLRRAMGEAGRRHVQTHYMWSQKVEYYRSVYAKILNEPAPTVFSGVSWARDGAPAGYM